MFAAINGARGNGVAMVGDDINDVSALAERT